MLKNYLWLHLRCCKCNSTNGSRWQCWILNGFKFQGVEQELRIYKDYTDNDIQFIQSLLNNVKKVSTVLFPQTIISALKHACEILTEDPEGGSAQIPFDTFQSLYTYLAHLDGEIPKEQIDSFLHSLEKYAWAHAHTHTHTHTHTHKCIPLKYYYFNATTSMVNGKQGKTKAKWYDQRCPIAGTKYVKQSIILTVISLRQNGNKRLYWMN